MAQVLPPGAKTRSAFEWLNDLQRARVGSASLADPVRRHNVLWHDCACECGSPQGSLHSNGSCRQRQAEAKGARSPSLMSSSGPMVRFARAVGCSCKHDNHMLLRKEWVMISRMCSHCMPLCHAEMNTFFTRVTVTAGPEGCLAGCELCRLLTDAYHRTAREDTSQDRSLRQHLTTWGSSDCWPLMLLY